MTLHTHGSECAYCDKKLILAHPDIVAWYRRMKAKWINLHISASWRDAVEQTHLLQAGLTNAPWPKSAHNHTLLGKPQSLALDLFTIDEDGIARWPWKLYAMIAEYNRTQREPIIWGGSWKSIHDGPHFELASAQQ